MPYSSSSYNINQIQPTTTKYWEIDGMHKRNPGGGGLLTPSGGNAFLLLLKLSMSK